jgi:hypothetical protein
LETDHLHWNSKQILSLEDAKRDMTGESGDTKATRKEKKRKEKKERKQNQKDC